MEKTNNTQSNANETIDTSTVQREITLAIDKKTREGKVLADVIEGCYEAKEALTKENNILEKRIDILHNRLAKVAEHFLTEQVQDVIYKTHQNEVFRERLEFNYEVESELWHSLDDTQKGWLSDILLGLGELTGMLLSEVYKAGIKACNTHGETLESLNNLEEVDVSKVFYDALPTNRY